MGDVCLDMSDYSEYFKCSVCGCTIGKKSGDCVDDIVITPIDEVKFCPHCRRKVLYI